MQMSRKLHILMRGYFYFLLFLCQKTNSIKRLLALNEELIKELIPDRIASKFSL